MTKLKISNRLQTIASLVDDNKKIIDIGCDHALLDVYLYQNKKNVKIIASDITDGPIKQALDNKKKYKADIKIKQGDGLETIEGDINTIIISGMGGNNIVEILTKDIGKLKNIDTLILSPQNDFYRLRKVITKLGFYITHEELLKDGKVIYLIIKFERGFKKYNEKDLYFGPIIRKNKTKEFIYLYNELLLKEKKIISRIPNKYAFRKIKKYKLINMLAKEIS